MSTIAIYGMGDYWKQRDEHTQKCKEEWVFIGDKTQHKEKTHTGKTNPC